VSEPAKQTTLYIVAYDIPNDRRRTKVHKVLSGFGRWTQYSLFEAWLTDKELITLRGRLDQHLNAKEDSVRFYALCAGCVGRVETIGKPPPQEEMLFLV
jgi:CRISPR-associated protein Cas2